MDNFKRVSLMTKLIILSLTTVSILGVGSWYSMTQIATAFDERVTANFEFLAAQLAETVEGEFRRHYEDAQVFAAADSVQSLNPKVILDDLNSYVEKYETYDLILVLDKDGKYIGSNTKGSGGKAVNTAELAKINYSDLPWFKAALGGNTTDDKDKKISGTYFEDIQADPILKTAFDEERIASGFSAPIKNKKGDVIGVISNRVSEKWVTAPLNSFLNTLIERNFHNAEVTLINKDGLILYQANAKALTGVKENQFKVNLIKLQNRAAISAVSGVSGADYISQSDRKEEMLAGYRNLSGQRWVSSIGWSVIITDSKADALTKVTTAMNNFYTLFGMIVFIAVAFSVFVAALMTKAFSSVTETLNKNSKEVDDASYKIASQATELSEASVQQAASLQETIAAVDEINAMVEKNAEAAGRSQVVSGQSRAAAENGQKIVSDMIGAINGIDDANQEINTQLNQSNQELLEITNLINDIGSKTKVINEIVFQTKLLSFNASVEAARAGEYGKGFSVVADEVGNLAQMSGSAAKEITALLEESVRKVELIVNESKSRVERLTAAAKERVDSGSAIANNCNEALNQIITNVQAVDGLVGEIAISSQEQSAGIREISKAIGQMEAMTQQNSSVAQASSVAAEQLKSQSTSLAAVVQHLVSHVYGGKKEKKVKVTKKATVLKFKGKNDKTVVPMNEEADPREPVMPTFKRAAGSDATPSADHPDFRE